MQNAAQFASYGEYNTGEKLFPEQQERLAEIRNDTKNLFSSRKCSEAEIPLLARKQFLKEIWEAGPGADFVSLLHPDREDGFF